MHAVVFVIDGSTFDVLPEGIIKKLKEMKTLVIERGMFFFFGYQPFHMI
jgi:hypothetical protein